MADFATNILTAADASAPGITGVPYSLRQGMDFSKEMKSRGSQITPRDGSGAAPRPTQGLIFPRGM